ncbi:MAG: hypothetical protein RI580_17150, partial [Halothece sp. Uz-M2-17]|nr:hypothetical protein [Halothece sp. Uz-M2-17]
MNPNDFSTNASQDKVTLHPNLQAALSSLNINLKEELERFQQQQKQRKEITLAQSQKESPSVNDHSPLMSSGTMLSEDNETSQEMNFDLPDSYLASSEELLRHLNGEEDHETFPSTQHLQNQTRQGTNPSSSSSWRDYLLTPLGVAGILIFFLSGTLLSLVLVNFAQARFTSPASTVETA